MGMRQAELPVFALRRSFPNEAIQFGLTDTISCGAMEIDCLQLSTSDPSAYCLFVDAEALRDLFDGEEDVFCHLIADLFTFTFVDTTCRFPYS